MKFSLSLFIFRRDLRLEDNTALIQALQNSERVIPAFLLNKEQLENNEYKSENALEFMFQSLKELNETLKKRGGKLYLFYGDSPHSILEKIFNKIKIDAVFLNEDYTPYSKKRDEKLKNLCKNFNIRFFSYSDLLLTQPDKILKEDGKPYTIFTHFYKKASQTFVPEPQINPYKNYYNQDIPDEVDINILDKILIRKNPHLFLKGGYTEGVSLLERIKELINYNIDRNFPAKESTSFLSPHNKFGTISIRKVYWTIRDHLGLESQLISELYWRDFFTYIAFHFPEVFGKPFQKKYFNFPWENDIKKFRAWCEGNTGFPIVDAGMRELNQTGYMHNRVRMIVASFLVKDMRIDWQWGEKYFAKNLVDYDPSVNNGSWQWSASMGCDAQPLRIFNPWLQQEKFDPDCEYIKKWIPELRSLTPNFIHNIYRHHFHNLNYPLPILDHQKEVQKTKEIFQRFRK